MPRPPTSQPANAARAVLAAATAGGLILWAAAGPAFAAECRAPDGLGVSRVVEIDTQSGPIYGDITKYARQADFLTAKEVVLTFDDGPLPWITKAILDALERHCARATFFSVGRMAIAYPETVKDVLARGHTLGTHTWSHPMSLKRLSGPAATAEIERGFAAVAAAAGQPIAPFFRFPGLNDSAALLAHLQSRGAATFTVDVVSNDSYIANPDRLARETLAKVEARGGGIMLFHDIKASTARALPAILDALKARGYRVVHMVAKTPFVPDQRLAAEYGAQIARAEVQRGNGPRKLLPFYGAAGPALPPAPVTVLVPPPQAYEESGRRPLPRRLADGDATAGGGWVTTIRRPRARTTRALDPL